MAQARNELEKEVKYHRLSETKLVAAPLVLNGAICNLGLRLKFGSYELVITLVKRFRPERRYVVVTLRFPLPYSRLLMKSI